MIHFILYNAGLELLTNSWLSPKILKHPAIKNDLKRRGKPISKILLDLVVHQAALPKTIGQNHGRPDILHQCLLQYLFSNIFLLESQKRNSNIIKCTVHTIDDHWFIVDPNWRPPIHYIRFRGLMEQFLDKKYLRVTKEQKLQLNSGTLQSILGQSKLDSKLIVFTSSGQPIDYKSFQNQVCSFYNNTKLEVICLIGAYQHGPPPEFLSKDKKWQERVTKITLPGGRLPSWKILGLTLSALELGCY